MLLRCDSEELKSFSKGKQYEIVREDKIHITLIDNNDRKSTMIKRFVNKHFKAVQ